MLKEVAVTMKCSASKLHALIRVLIAEKVNSALLEALT